jgi:hypothetical protein
MMEPMVFRAIEITFASYMVPALLLPLVWLAAWLRKRHLRIEVQTRPEAEAEGQSRRLFWLFLLWAVLFVAVISGLPLRRGGELVIAACWLAYAITNVLLAWFFLRFTASYGSIPAGRAADRAFLRFIAIVVAQPVMTAAAFVVLSNVMGLAWNAQIPDLPAIQEGI